MQRYLKYLIAFTALIFIIGHIGFHEKYIALFPTFNDVSNTTHFHATLMFLWLALLVVQPFLIFTKRVTLHKIIGRTTYIIAPLLILSMFLITNQGYLSKIKRMTEVEANASLSVNIPDFFAFGILYFLAIRYRKRTDWHSRFMIATIFPIIGAALVRIFIRYFDISSTTAFSMVPYISNGLCLIFIFTDIKTKKYVPYLFALTVLLIEQIIWILRYTDAWQGFAKYYVDIFV